MDNSISINLGNKNNDMNLFQFYWMALLKNGDYIKQYEDDVEHRFQEVIDKFKELQFFYLYNKNNFKEKFIVDLENGFVYKNIIIQDFKETDNKKNNIRLIYKRVRRNKITTGNVKSIKEEIHYLLGLQYSDKLGNNKKIILQIDNEGNWILGD
jgi:hypothetical protein